MPDQLTQLHARVERLADDLGRMESRLAALESRRQEALASDPSPSVGTSAGAAEMLPPGMVALLGRTLVALGGGYLIRALADADAPLALGGVGLGLAYALAWLVQADRAAAAGHRVSAAFHGLTSGLIAYPLLWETTVRFGLFRPPAALATLVLVFGAGIAVAGRRKLSFLAWVSACLALGTTASLLVSTFHLLAVLSALLAIAIVVEWLAWHDLWLGLRWPAALTLDAALLVAVVLVSRPAGLPEGYAPTPAPAAVAVALAVPAIYVSAIVARTLRRGCPVTLFESMQGPVALVLGFGGAWRLLAEQAAPAVALGGLSVVLGALCYAAAFAFIERREGHHRNFYFYSSSAGAMTLVGSWAILERAPLCLAWCILAVACAASGRVFGRATLRLHGAVYTWAATLAAGLAGDTWRAFFAPASGAWPLPGAPGWITAIAALAAYVLVATDRGRAGRWPERVPQAVAAAAAAWTLGGLLLAGLALALALESPAAVATLRTGTLAFLVLVLGGAARRWALPELALFVYPLLAIGGLKLVAEDLRQGRALTLFLSLVLYGGALIAAPRLVARER